MYIKLEDGLCSFLMNEYTQAQTTDQNWKVVNNYKALKCFRYIALQNKEAYSPQIRRRYHVGQIFLSIFGKSDYQASCKLIKKHLKNIARNENGNLKNSDAKKFAKIYLDYLTNINQMVKGNKVQECENLKKNFEESLPEYLRKALSNSFKE